MMNEPTYTLSDELSLALIQAAAAVIEDASPCTSAGQSMVSDELLAKLEQAIEDATE